MKLSILNRVKELYEKEHKNIIEYLKQISNQSNNTIEDILISYDFQAGTYSKGYYQNPTKRNVTSDKIAQYINQLDPIDSFLEVGVGEATSLMLLLKRLTSKPQTVKGIDLSWSRIKKGLEFLKENNINDAELATGDLFNLPFNDNSAELVFTFQAIEPNRGREEEALKELYRVSKKYLVLVEPCYEIANIEAKVRMDKNGYIKGLYETALRLGFKVLVHEPLGTNLNDLNPVSILIIEKNPENESELNWSCPLTKTTFINKEDCFYSKESLLAYPIIQGIPCLLPSNAIVATKMED